MIEYNKKEFSEPLVRIEEYILEFINGYLGMYAFLHKQNFIIINFKRNWRAIHTLHFFNVAGDQSVSPKKNNETVSKISGETYIYLFILVCLTIQEKNI